MIEYLLFDNHGLSVPYKHGAKTGLLIPDVSLEELHEAARLALFDQVKHAVLAEEHGYHYYFHSEHHFNTEGTEHNTSNFVVQAAQAALTTRIRLGQLANILPWWDPIRLAEQAAALDVLSNGRLEFGIGRGYQPREGETFGALLGSSVQDQEKNRAYFEEAFEVIIRAWTQPSMSFHGDFFQIPPAWAMWAHPQTEDYLDDEVSGVSAGQVLSMAPRPPGARPLDAIAKPGGGPMVSNGTATLKEVSVFPRPRQVPHPQVWVPVTSDRSVGWAARNATNGYLASEPEDTARMRVQKFMEFSETAGWPDRLGRGEFKYGWDCEKRRGIVVGRGIYCTENGVGTEDQIRTAVNAEMSFFLGNGFDFLLRDDDGKLVDSNLYFDKWTDLGLGYVGTNDQIIESFIRLHKLCGYGDDFIAAVQIARPSFSAAQVEDQIINFAENIMPVLSNEFGGSKPIESVAPVLPN